MDYSQAWMGPWGQALQASPLGGLMSPWAMGSQGAQGIVPQTGLQSLVRQNSEGGETKGFDVGGDPSKAAQTSQTTRDRVASALGGAIGTSAAKSGLGALGAYASGMPSGMLGQAALGGLTSPGSLGGVLGAGVNATIGTQPQGFLGKAVAYGAPVIGSVLGGPFGGLMGGMFGGVLGDALSDALDSRKNEALRDSVEDNRGYFGGRAAIADMQSVMDKVNAMQESVAQNVAGVNKAREIAGLGRVGYSPSRMSLDTIAPGGYGMSGTGSSNTSGGWGGYDPGHASTGFGLGGRAAEVARGAMAGVDFGGFSADGGRGGRDSGGFGSNDGDSDTAGNGGFGR